MDYQIIPVGPFEVNCVVLWDDRKRATVVDPGADAEALRNALSARDLRLEQIVLTHGHIDHISALDGLLQTGGTPVYLHEEDAAWAFSDLNRIPPYDRVPARPSGLVGLEEDRVLSIAGVPARVLHTPGHSPGAVCLYLESEGLLLCGDTLFAGSVGRTDLPGGNGAKLARSLKRLAQLPPETRVIAGHGPATSIAAELRHNPFLRLQRGASGVRDESGTRVP